MPHHELQVINDDMVDIVEVDSMLHSVQHRPGDKVAEGSGGLCSRHGRYIDIFINTVFFIFFKYYMKLYTTINADII